MEEAIIGFIGVIVGASVTSVLDVVRARIDARRSAKHSARLVFLEVAEAAAALTAIREREDHGVTPGDLDQLLVTWHEHRGSLVVALPATDLGLVFAFFALVRRVSSLLRQAQSDADPGEGLAECRDVASQVAGVLDGIPNALEPLVLSRKERRDGESLNAIFAITNATGSGRR